MNCSSEQDFLIFTAIFSTHTIVFKKHQIILHSDFVKSVLKSESTRKYQSKPLFLRGNALLPSPTLVDTRQDLGCDWTGQAGEGRAVPVVPGCGG